jgi:hypothetical protein
MNNRIATGAITGASIEGRWHRLLRVLGLCALIAVFALGPLPASAQVRAGAENELLTVVIVSNLNVAGCEKLAAVAPFAASCTPDVLVVATLPPGASVRFDLSYLDSNGKQQEVIQVVDAGGSAVTKIADGTATTQMFAPGPRMLNCASFAFYPGADFNLQRVTGTLLLPHGSVEVTPQ